MPYASCLMPHTSPLTALFYHSKKVDVTTEIIISKSPEIVSEYAMNPDNAPEWYKNIKSVEWKTPGPLFIGSEVVFVAHKYTKCVEINKYDLSQYLYPNLILLI